MPKISAGRPVIIRAAITRVVTVSPLVNTVGTILLVGPLDRGGAAVELEAVDAETGTQVAALKFGHYPPLSDLAARFSRLSPAEIALKKAVVDFSELLTPSVAAGVITPISHSVNIYPPRCYSLFACLFTYRQSIRVSTTTLNNDSFTYESNS
jgi:Protein of unknown function (DUF3313)